MIRCSNENCDKNPLDSPIHIIINTDGDAVCDRDCEQAYKQQRDHFFDVTIHSEELTRDYLLARD